MSRRDSRVDLATRQNDTLLEFENFKKKFLLANKQITRQNTLLNKRIEELQGHISSLYVENLRLRASEIALCAQLKQERERGRNAMAEAEHATLQLLKQLGVISQSYNISPLPSPSSKKPDSPPPRCTAPPPRSPVTPALPGISEDPEPHEVIQEDNDGHSSHSDTASSLTKTTRRTSSSRLPVPARVVSPPPSVNVQPPKAIDFSAHSDSKKKRSLTRRRSGLMNVPLDLPPRPMSPAFGSPVRPDSPLSDVDDDCTNGTEAILLSDGQIEKVETYQVKPKKEKKMKVRDASRSSISHKDMKETKKAKDRASGPELKLKDVTNSPCRPNCIPMNDVVEGIEVPIVSISPTSPQVEEVTGYLPTPVPSSRGTSPAPSNSEPQSDFDVLSNASRERRVRKSVNYAEPKLNTKMRKPDSIPPPGARPSLLLTPSPTPDLVPHPDVEHTEETGIQAKPKSNQKTDSRPSHRPSSRKVRKSYYDDSSDGAMEEDDGDDADAEYSDFKSDWVNTSSRRRSTHTSPASENIGHTARHEGESGRRHSMAV